MTHQKLLNKLRVVGAIWLIVGSIVVVGCGESVEPATSPETAQASPAEETESAAAGELFIDVPETVLASVIQDIASSENIPVEDLKLEDAQPQSWPDGCLGLAQPDELCTFAIVEGWEVTMSQGDNRWTYRTDSDGSLVKQASSEVASES